MIGWRVVASRGAFRTKHLLKQQSGDVVDVVPLVVVWASGQPESPEILRGVTGLSGRSPRAYLMSLPASLSSEHVERIHAGLESAARDFDVAAGVRHPGWIRRLFM